MFLTHEITIHPHFGAGLRVEIFLSSIFFGVDRARSGGYDSVCMHDFGEYSGWSWLSMDYRWIGCWIFGSETDIRLLEFMASYV